MILRTKKTRLTPSTYIRIALLTLLRQQWWVVSLFIASAIGLFLKDYKITALVTSLLLPLYILFWWSQFYGLTKLEDNKLMFERIFYELSNERIVIFLNPKQGMPIDWKQIKSAKQRKNYFLLIISKAQFIYLPHSAFKGEQQISLVKMLLKNKKLL